MRLVTIVLSTACALALATSPAVAAPGKGLSPIPADDAVSVHSPFEMGACETCHARRDPKDPGPAAVTNDTCFNCHDDFKSAKPVKMDKAVHTVAKGSCLACHAPHNSKKKKLLL